jgi:hypothetical protein
MLLFLRTESRVVKSILLISFSIEDNVLVIALYSSAVGILSLLNNDVENEVANEFDNGIGKKYVYMHFIFTCYRFLIVFTFLFTYIMIIIVFIIMY